MKRGIQHRRLLPATAGADLLALALLAPTTCLVDRIALDQLPPLVRGKAEEITPLGRDMHAMGQ